MIFLYYFVFFLFRYYIYNIWVNILSLSRLTTTYGYGQEFELPRYHKGIYQNWGLLNVNGEYHYHFRLSAHQFRPSG
jgi:hypothetical protein